MGSHAAFIDCSEAMLGNLASQCLGHFPDQNHSIIPDHRSGEVVINGVALPRRVADQLRLLGISLSWYSGSELADAVEACAYDSVLVDDVNGVNFNDKLTLTDREKQQFQVRPYSFAERVKDTRAKNLSGFSDSHMRDTEDYLENSF
jgi:hypothetical protein